MSAENITEEELTKERASKGLLEWVEAKMDQIASTDKGETAIRLREDPLVKQLVEEVYILGIFASKKYGNTDTVYIKPIIGSQNYDAVVVDYSHSPAQTSYIEVTQAHEGEVEYLRTVYLQKHGYVPVTGSIKKIGTKKTGLQVSTSLEAESVDQAASREFQKIYDAIHRKEGKKYPPDTSLIVKFDDGPMFRRVADDNMIDTFVMKNIMGLDLRFSTLSLVGKFKKIFRHYDLIRSRGQITRIITK